MAVNNRTSRVSYALSDALLDIPHAPIIATRAPTTSDKAALGTIWIDKPNNDSYILTSVTANSATWINAGGGSGSFSSITVNPGDIDVTAGDINVSAGDVVVTTGGVVAESDISTASGNIDATTGSIEAGTTVTAGTGLVAVTGGVLASAGDITAILGDITATAGKVNGLSVYATGDDGGVAATTSLTASTNTTQGVGNLTILSTNANSGDNAGFIKVYVGTTTAYIPYFTNIAP